MISIELTCKSQNTNSRNLSSHRTMDGPTVGSYKLTFVTSSTSQQNLSPLSFALHTTQSHNFPSHLPPLPPSIQEKLIPVLASVTMPGRDNVHAPPPAYMDDNRRSRSHSHSHSESRGGERGLRRRRRRRTVCCICIPIPCCDCDCGCGDLCCDDICGCGEMCDMIWELLCCLWD